MCMKEGVGKVRASAAIPGKIICDEVLPARADWHRHLSSRIVDLAGCQAVDTLICNAKDTAIRYNAANAIYLPAGLHDHIVQPMMMTEDTVGRHDILAGNRSRERNMVGYGDGTLELP
jgi:uncharacterized protein YcgI (DUF1989 family)